MTDYSLLNEPGQCDPCGRMCDGEALTSGFIDHVGDTTACAECRGHGKLIPCRLGCGLWCDPSLGDLCNRHHWLVVETSMLPREIAEWFLGIQTGDGAYLALWNAPGGTTRAVAVGPQPAWVYESEAA